jgi:hypothetical protein
MPVPPPIDPVVPIEEPVPIDDPVPMELLLRPAAEEAVAVCAHPVFAPTKQKPASHPAMTGPNFM